MAELTMDADVLIKFLAEISDFQDKVTQVTGELDTVTEKQAEVAQSGSDMAKASGSSMQAMAGVASIARQVNPQLGRLATLTMGASRAMRGLGIAVGSAIKAVAPVAAALAVTYGAYRVFTRDARAATEQSERFAEVQANVQDAVAKSAETLLRAKVITGELTAAEFNRIKAAAQANEVWGPVIDQLKERNEVLERQIELDETALRQSQAPRQGGILAGTAQPVTRSAAEITQALQDQRIELSLNQIELSNARFAMEEFSQAIQIVQNGPSEDGQGGVVGLTESLGGLRDVMQDLPTETFRFDGAEMDLREPLQQNEESAKEMAITYSDAFGSMANSAGKLNQALGGNAQEQFKRGQALALAEVAFNTASAVMKALPNVPLSVAMGTAGAANAALVMAQQPPPAHMGLVPSSTGPLAPDEMNTRVLKGEAVLDRATVRRMGGAQGVRDLMQGGGGNGQTVVVVPWKHLDRELQTSGRANSRFGRTMRRNAQISTGQRG